MSQVASADVWDEWNRKRATDAQNGGRLELTRAAVEAFRALVPPTSRVLDVGVGAGFTTELVHAAYDYLGLDIGEASIAVAKQRNPLARLEIADFLEWDAPELAFGGLLCVETVAYRSDQDAALAKMARTLKAGGWLVLTTVNPFVYEQFRWIRDRERQGQPRMGKWLDLHGLIQRNGFRIWRSTTVAPEGDQGWLRLVNGRRVKKLLGRPYKRALETVGLGQYRLVAARKE